MGENANSAKKMSIIVMSPSIVLMTQYIILSFFNIFDSGAGMVVQAASKVIVVICFLFGIKDLIKCSLVKIILIYCIMFVYFSILIILYSKHQSIIISTALPLFIMSVPCFLYSNCIRNFKIFYNIMKAVSHYIMILVFLYYIFGEEGFYSTEDYSMSLGYYTIFPVIVYAKEYMMCRKKRYLLLIAGGLFMILMIGSRGPLLCAGSFIIVELISAVRISYKIKLKSLITVFIVIGCIIIVGVYWYDIITVLAKKIEDMGFANRTLQLLLEGKLLSDSGRGEFQGVIMQAVVDKPFLGNGIGMDRVIIDTYPHNLFLEILFDFGIVFGGLICVALVFFCIYVICHRMEVYERACVNILFSVGVIPLFVSGTYLDFINFWIFLGVSISAVRKERGVSLEQNK